MFTSCCPAWVNYVEKSNPQLIPNLSSCKSPMSMLGALIKTDFAKIKKIDPRSIVSVSIMPCTAKKDEARRSELSDESGQNTDIVISTRELARLIKSKKIDYKKIPDQKYDKLYAEYTGGGVIFGSSGGVMEAALRSAYQILTGNPLSQLDILPIRAGKDGIKFSEVHINGSTVKVAVCQGVANAKKLVEKIQKKDPSVADLKFVEVMACPGGCVNGGGSSKAKNAKAVQDRAGALYKLDSNLKQRVSLDNSELKEFYRRSLKGFGSHEAHEILHTHFKSKK
uniref:Fe-hydrogenase n=1 Tax=Coptotermes formosanus TaxID=36987 RepID=R4UXD6_COPFO|nr:Fe-hydrogenase [Coptotermes formosanus]